MANLQYFYTMNTLQRLIVMSRPIQAIIRFTKAVSLPGFKRLPLYDVLQFYWGQLVHTGIGQRAAAISFNLIIAIPAGFLFLFTIVPKLPKAIRAHFNDQLMKLITAYFTPNPATEIWLKESISDFINIQRGGLSIIGLVLIVWATSNAMIGITESFDHSIVTKKNKTYLQHRFTAIKLTGLLVLLVIACVILLISEGAALHFVLQYFKLQNDTVKLLIKTLDWLVIILISFLAIGSIYRYAPSVHKRWRLVTPGSILTTFLLLLTTFIFSYYVNNFSNYNKLYGSVGTVIILMLIVYFNSVVLLLGFELNNSITTLNDKYKLSVATIPGVPTSTSNAVTASTTTP